MPAIGRAEGGTIQFSGAVVVDAYTPVMRSRASAASFSVATGAADVRAVELTLHGEGLAHGRVDASAVGVGGTGLTTQCTPSGRATSASAGACRVGPEGGKLTLIAKGGPPRAAANAVVTLAYD